VSHRRILVGAAARRTILAPLLRNVRAVAVSLGPYGRPVLYEPNPGGVAVASDGLAIARETAESGGIAGVGGRILYEALFASNRDLGDGAARLACIFGGIVEAGFRSVAAGGPPQQLADAVIRLNDEVRRLLQDERCEAPPLTRMVSALTGDAVLADAVARALSIVGADGVVDVKEQPGDGVDVEGGRGFTFDAMLASSLLGPIPPATALELNDVFVLAANESIADFGQLGPILEGFAKSKKSLAVVAREVTGSALDALVRNRREIGLHVVALKPADLGPRAAHVIEDLAIATGATLVGAEVGVGLDRLRPAMLGRAARLQIARDRALFVSPAGGIEAIDARCALLAAEAERTRYLAYDREQALRRAARLKGSWSELRCGRQNTHFATARVTEARAAVVAAQSALRSGVVAGGGAALVRIAARLRANSASRDEVDRAARGAVAQGLEAVAFAIMKNAGRNARAIVEELRGPAPPGYGIDARNSAFGDIVGLGIADPLAVTEGLVVTAMSAAATLLRTCAIIGNSAIAASGR